MFGPYSVDDETDHEAECALDTLLRAEEIKASDFKFLDRIADVIDKKSEALGRIREVLDTETEMSAVSGFGDLLPEDTRATSRIDDFLSRMKRKHDDEEMKTDETPAERRSRVASRRQLSLVIAR